MISAIVLAAGSSRRMGTQKLLLPFGRGTVIEHIVDQLIESSVKDIRIVTGHKGLQIADVLSDRDISMVTNPDHGSGMLSSVRCGLSGLPENCHAVMVLLGDQPSITSDLINQLIHAFEKTNKGIAVPLYNCKRGHPLLFPISYIPEIMKSFNNVGLRGLLVAHPDDIFELRVSSPSVISDMDLPEDYLREISEFNNNSRRTS